MTAQETDTISLGLLATRFPVQLPTMMLLMSTSRINIPGFTGFGSMLEMLQHSQKLDPR